MPGDKDKPKPFTCMYCEKTCDTPNGLKRHMGMHNQTLFNCNICNKSFAKEGSFNKHLKTHKEKTKSYSCNTCKESFHHAGDLLRHIRTCVTKEKLIFECNFCQKKFSRWSFFSKHLKMHESSLKLFSQCNSDSGNQTELLVVAEQQFFCSICPSIFNKKFNLDRHMKRHLNEVCHACKVCKKVFTTREYLMIHMRIHSSDPLTCAFCKNKYTDIVEFNNHIKNHSQKNSLGQENSNNSTPASDVSNQKNLFICSFCHIHFINIDDLERHVSSHRSISNLHSAVSLNIDPCCDQKNLNSLTDITTDISESDDLMEHDGISFENVVDNEESEIKNCSSAAVNAQNNEEKIFCDACQICFTCLEDLKTHKESQICSSHYQTVKRYKNEHTAGDKFTCDTCHDQFVSLECLQIHSRNHSQKSSSYEGSNTLSMQTENFLNCDTYHINFTNKNDHDIHMKSHADSNLLNVGVKKNICQDPMDNSSIQLTNESISIPEVLTINEVNSTETCETNFSGIGQQHNIEKPFVCNECQHEFMNLESLDIHVKHHANHSTSVINSNNSALDHSFKCGICQNSIDSIEELLTHINRHEHESDECQDEVSIEKQATVVNVQTGSAFICSVCQNEFKCLEELDAHLKSHSNSNLPVMKIHTGNKSFVCSMCQSEFALMEDLHAHRRNHANFSDRSEQFTEFEDINLHVENHTDEITSDESSSDLDMAEENICNHQDESNDCQDVVPVENITTMMNVHTDRAFSCDVCQNEFDCMGDLDTHLRTHSDKLLPIMNIHAGNRPFICGTCQSEFMLLEDLNMHMRNHANSSDRSEQFTEFEDINLHVENHSDDITSEENSSDPAMQEENIHNNHQDGSIRCQDIVPIENTTTIMNVNTSRVCICGVCQNEFDCMEDLDTHLSTHPDNLLPIMNIHAGNKPFICGMCQSEFALMEDLDMHVRNHAKSSDRREQFTEVEDMNLQVENHIDDILSHENFSDLTITTLQEDITYKNNDLGESSECQDIVPVENTATIMNIHTGRVFICGICQNEFTCMEDLDTHLRTHSDNLLPIMNIPAQNEPFICGMCQSEFMLMEDLDMHTRNHANSSDRYEQFTKIEDINLQVNNHTDNIISQENSSDLGVISILQDNTYNNSHQEESVECPDIVPIENTATIMNVHTGRSFICGVCQNDFDCMEDLDAHLRTHSDNLLPIMNIPAQNEPFICGICQSEFMLMEDLDMHTRNHANSSDRYEQFTKIEDINLQINNHTDDIISQENSSDLGVISLLQDNTYNNSHQEESVECPDIVPIENTATIMNVHTGRSFLCGVCQNDFDCMEDLDAHLRTHSDNLLPIMNIPAQNEPFICGICQSEFMLMEDLDMHTRNHANSSDRYEQFTKIEDINLQVNNHTDDIISQENSSDLGVISLLQDNTYNNSHQEESVECPDIVPIENTATIMNVHTGRSFICGVCQNDFDCMEDLDAHLRTHSDNLLPIMNIHSGSKPFICGMCQSEFTLIEDLDIHVQNHANASGICDQFTKMEDINLQVDNHTDNIISQENSSDMQIISLQENNNAYVCGICQEELGNIDELDQHVRSHGSDADACVFSIAMRKATNTHLSGSFVCSLCNTQFVSHEDYCLHIQTHVSGANSCENSATVDEDVTSSNTFEGDNFICESCQTVFSCKDNLEMHLRSHAEGNESCENYLNNHTKSHTAINQNQISNTVENDEAILTNLGTGVNFFTCQLCTEQFMTAEEVHIHLSKHLHENHTNKQVFTATEIETNLDESSTSFMCGICHIYCTNLQDLQNHLRNHLSEYNVQASEPSFSNEAETNAFTCNVCHIQLPSNEEFDRHLAIHATDNVINLQYAPQELNEINTMETQNPTSFVCGTCHSAFENINHLNTHLSSHDMVHHPDQVPFVNIITSDNSFACDACQSTFLSEDELNDHVRTHEHNEEIHQNSITFECDTTTAEDILPNSSSVFCDICQCHFISLEELQEHLLTHTLTNHEPKCIFSLGVPVVNVVPMNDELFVCGICGQNDFSSVGELDSHLDFHVSQNNAHQIAEQVSENRLGAHTSDQCFTCDFCQCHFSTKQDLDVHLESHAITGENQDVIMLDQALTDGNVLVEDISLMCNFCDSCFENIYEFQDHVKSHTISNNAQATSALSTHSGDGQLTDIFCYANCDTVENLDSHMTSQVEPLCPDSSLLDGSCVAMDVDISPESFICKVCQSPFSNIDDLNIHFTQHTSYDCYQDVNL